MTTIRAFARISKQTEESASIEIQQAKIKVWRDLYHPGVEIKFYVEPGVSGFTAKALKRRTAMLAEARRGDVLVATKIDRLARNVRDLLDIVTDCDERGVVISFVDQPQVDASAFGKFMITLLGALAELERNITSERVAETAAHHRAVGRFGSGSLPYGWRAEHDPARGFLVARPDPVAKPKVRAAVLAVINGASQRSQAQALGLPFPTFHKLITNPRLYGQIPGDGALYDADMAIISHTEWLRLQRRLKGPKAWSKAAGFGKLLNCAGCGERLYLNTARRPQPEGAYGCAGNHKGLVSVGRRIADEFITDLFLGRYGDEPETELVEVETGERDEELAALTIEIGDITGRLNVGYDPALVADLEQAHARRAELLAVEPDEDNGWTRRARVETGRTLGQAWQAAETDAERVALVNSMALSITVHPAADAPETPSRWVDDQGVSHVRLPGRFEIVETPFPALG
jgi:DNA invertase Pin-like site-specific DNA recombinase